MQWLRKRDAPAPRRDYRAGRFFDPCDPTDGQPRLVVTWVTNAEGESGFSVDWFNLAARDVAAFYAGAAATVARCAVGVEEVRSVDAERATATQ